LPRVAVVIDRVNRFVEAVVFIAILVCHLINSNGSIEPSFLSRRETGSPCHQVTYTSTMPTEVEEEPIMIVNGKEVI
jgi:hypothetical protein